ncbi:Hypothetical protein I595_2720 [Croceitalea dokdonensis DOKDO 023]|uniref:Uncharacterized protein n=1 Tax=Croceitalea dokdonensis DOKDO 023 TaxID=1300341 RepID=A0A0N8H3T3_9FLAO|nr:Hypothetical protein I595_2720 [Croceitalea dokdonensis DOKDO 023]
MKRSATYLSDIFLVQFKSGQHLWQKINAYKTLSFKFM